MENKLYFYKELNKPIDAKIVYNAKDMSIFTKPTYISDITIMTGAIYLGLDLNLSNMLILSVWGHCPKHCWITTSLKSPTNIEEGEIKLKTDRNLIMGVGIDLAKETPIYFCEESNWICVGDKNVNNYDCNVRFMENAIMSLKKNEFKALWLNPVYE